MLCRKTELRVKGTVASQTRGTVLLCLGKKSRAGPVTETRVIHSPVITRQVCSDKASPRSSWEVKSGPSRTNKAKVWAWHSYHTAQARNKGKSLG